MGRKNAREKRRCKGKTRHETYPAAVAHIMSLQRAGKVYTPMRAYECRVIPPIHFHVGHERY